MSLRRDAIELSAALGEIVGIALACQDLYVGEFGRRIVPMLSLYDHAVFDSRSHEHASEAIAGMAGQMESLSATAAKLELHDFDRQLAQYWQLRTIFQEVRYRDQTL